LYRLLQRYPAGKLLILETDVALSSPERRLENIQYRRLPIPGAKLLRSRFTKAYSALLWWRARRAFSGVAAQMRGFSAQAVLSVAHGYHWATAARLAKKLQIPFYLIIHDDPLQLTALPKSCRHSLSSAFAA